MDEGEDVGRGGLVYVLGVVVRFLAVSLYLIFPAYWGLIRG
jgi:hypothetical protein